MKYVSTRGGAPVLEFGEVLLAGLARDGGLYLPEAWPKFSAAEIRALAGLAYPEIALRVMRPFVGPAISEDRLRAIVEEAIARSIPLPTGRDVVETVGEGISGEVDGVRWSLRSICDTIHWFSSIR